MAFFLLSAKFCFSHLKGPVVQRADNVIHWINYSSVDTCQFQLKRKPKFHKINSEATKSGVKFMHHLQWILNCRIFDVTTIFINHLPIALVVHCQWPWQRRNAPCSFHSQWNLPCKGHHCCPEQICHYRHRPMKIWVFDLCPRHLRIDSQQGYLMVSSQSPCNWTILDYVADHWRHLKWC